MCTEWHSGFLDQGVRGSYRARQLGKIVGESGESNPRPGGSGERQNDQTREEKHQSTHSTRCA